MFFEREKFGRDDGSQRQRIVQGAAIDTGLFFGELKVYGGCVVDKP